MNVGAVANIRRIKSAIAVARHVLEHTYHSILVGELATDFAVQMGFQEESLTTNSSKQLWMNWRNKNSCQPNFWLVSTFFFFRPAMLPHVLVRWNGLSVNLYVVGSCLILEIN